jgi:hypothetical protein
MHANAPLALVCGVKERGLEDGPGLVGQRFVVLEETGNRFV